MPTPGCGTTSGASAPALATLAVALCACALTACGPAAADGAARARTAEAELAVDGWTRTYRVHVPPGRRGPLPLLVVLHGGGGSGEQIEEVTGFSGIADREGFVVVYPDGLGLPHGFARAWNAGDCCGKAYILGVSDLAFVRRLIVETSSRLPIDRDRVFVAGWSNGAALALAVGSHLADLVAGIAPYAGSMHGTGPPRAPLFDLPPPARPVSVIAIHGTADPRVPYEGKVTSDGLEASFAQAGRFWAVAAGCRAHAERRVERGGAVRVDTYRHCAAGAEVETLTLAGWDHDWPGRSVTDGLPASHPLRGFDAAERIWAFFATHGRPRR